MKNGCFNNVLKTKIRTFAGQTATLSHFYVKSSSAQTVYSINVTSKFLIVMVY